MKRIAIIGHFGGDRNDCLDGQTVKTRILYQELISNTDWNIQKIDTYYKKKHPLYLINAIVRAVLFRKDLIVLLSINGMRFLFPLLFFLTKFFRIKVFHDVIGGNLHLYVNQYPCFKKYLNSFVINWVETERLRKQLNEVGVDNCAVIPNFKRLRIVKMEELESENKQPFKFCTFSRVMKEKGIEAAISCIQDINKERDSVVCSLDIYGPIELEYSNHFEQLMQNTPDYIRYKGTVPFDQSVEVLKNYYALLFPTFWIGEGFPGTIIDAFSAGLPVIASDWNSNAEIVDNFRDGIVYPNETVSSLKDSVLFLINNNEDHIKMRSNCINKASYYQPELNVQKIINAVEESSKNGSYH